MFFFLYGTLIDASGTPAARWLQPRLRSVRPASVPGRLFAIADAHGWYPALRSAPPWQRVHGTCCELDLGRGDLARLDRYEGRAYRRASGRARVVGKLVTVQHYRWRGALPKAAEPVPGGDFLEWLDRRRLRPFDSPSGEFRRAANFAHPAISSGANSL